MNENPSAPPVLGRVRMAAATPDCSPERIIDLAKQVQDEDRYGHLTNPVVMGLLMAVQVLEGDGHLFGLRVKGGVAHV